MLKFIDDINRFKQMYKLGVNYIPRVFLPLWMDGLEYALKR